MRTRWLSAHIFYSGDRDLLLRHLVYPFVSQHSELLSKDTPFFFIRYKEGGDHIRLRMLSHCHALLKETLVIAAETFFCHFPFHAQINKGEEGSYPENSVQFIEYIPEIDRYGDRRSMPWAESYFWASSALILQWMNDQTGTPFSNAIKLHLILFKAAALTKEEMITICKSFMEDWLIVLHRASNHIDRNDQFWLMKFEQTIQPQLDSLILAVGDFLRQIDDHLLADELTVFNQRTSRIIAKYMEAGFSIPKLYAIIKSFIHMNHNRVGIKNHEESYLLFCIYKCLQY